MLESTLPRGISFADSALKMDSERAPFSIPNAEQLAQRFEGILESSKSEQELQTFFEEFPHFLPGISTHHHGPLYNVVVSKLPLGNDFITDFAFVSSNSSHLRLTCIEIESASKQIFRKDGQFRQEYHQALQQVVDWNQWAHENIAEAAKLFRPITYGVNTNRGFESIQIQCYLVAGRRSQISNRKRQERYSSLSRMLPKSIEVMTYDRILRNIEIGWHWPFEHRMLICSYRNREMVVKNVAI